jgi:hypothetical protein
VPEGLGPGEVGKEIVEHHHHQHLEHVQEGESRGTWISIIEAVILSLVAVLAAYSGFAAAKWSTTSSISLAKASSLRTKSNTAAVDGVVTRTLDAVTFNAVFSAFLLGNKQAEQLAERRLRPGYRPAFYAWLATDPLHNPHAPPGPAYMPQYVIPEERLAAELTKQADQTFAKGSAAGETADKYVRDTVFLATVLFLVGISGHFQIRAARLGIIGVGVAILLFAVVQLIGLPAPP